MLYALLAILIALIIFGLVRGYKLGALMKMSISNLKVARNIVMVMLMVGAMTALWRAGGTIPYIVSLTSGALEPAVFLPVAFLMNSAISALTGTSVGTAASIGSICMSVGNALGISPAVCGGVVLSGAFFGDRCSPVSTSALLVAEVTQTNLYDNIRGMIRTCVIPFAVALAVFAAMGILANTHAASNTSVDVFEAFYNFHWTLVLPAVSILVLALLRIDVKINMMASIAIAAVITFVVQGVGISDVARIAFIGYDAPEEISSMMSGGGVLSMAKLCCIILISLTFVGLFKGMGILDKIRGPVQRLGNRSPFGCMIVTAFTTCMVSCNQSMCIILTNELCKSVVDDKNRRAIYIENSSVVIAGLVPWSMASLVPLGAMGAPTASILFAAYLYLIPLSQWIFSKKSN